jgi:hypothetical protein
MMRVPITDPLWQVRLAQQGLAPSEATMKMARLLLAIRLDQAAKSQSEITKKGAEGDDKK